MRRWLRYFLASILLLIALVLTVLPGPAILFVIFAFALIFPRSIKDVLAEYKTFPKEKRGWRVFISLLKKEPEI